MSSFKISNKKNVAAASLLCALGANSQSVTTAAAASESSAMTIESGITGYDRFSEFKKTLAAETYSINTNNGFKV